MISFTFPWVPCQNSGRGKYIHLCTGAVKVVKKYQQSANIMIYYSISFHEKKMRRLMRSIVGFSLLDYFDFVKVFVSFIPYFCLLVFGTLVTLCSCVIFSVFFCLAHLALQNVSKDYVTFLYFCNFVRKNDQKWEEGNNCDLLFLSWINIYYLLHIRSAVEKLN